MSTVYHYDLHDVGMTAFQSIQAQAIRDQQARTSRRLNRGYGLADQGSSGDSMVTRLLALSNVGKVIAGTAVLGAGYGVYCLWGKK